VWTPALVVAALLVGGLAGGLVAVRVNMLQIPAMVAFQHGAGGIAAFLISFVELMRERANATIVGQFSGMMGIVVGAATFSGSMVASARLAGITRQSPTVLPRHNGIIGCLVLLLLALAAGVRNSNGPAFLYSSLGLILVSIVLGAVFSIRVGGADMPVLISFLNATAGLAAAFCGIVVENRLLIAAGATVAASGSLLTHAMCRAMNRNLFEVFIPAVRATVAEVPRTAEIPPIAPGSTTEPTAAESHLPIPRAAEAARNATKIIVAPGYGMALAHAQFEVVKLANRLRDMGKEVKFAIHPIAGRMPGHMHVLLGEAEADPDMIYDMAEINSQFQTTDLAIVVGACDVVNPAARHAEGTSISGMPILAAHEAKQILVCNLDGGPGYSGVDNPLYTNPKAILLFGDAKASLVELLEALH
jgi:NAD(P) transhydrogenase subunit beta